MSLYARRLDSDRREIRLLVVEPGEDHEILACRLRTVSLDDQVSYTALSYVWGDPLLTRMILVDGQAFEATANLESALRHLRADLAGKELWVDAVCINQQDVEEKRQQVALMGALYSQAAGVTVWLGEEDLAVRMLMEAMTHYHDQLAGGSQSQSSLETSDARGLRLRKRAAMFKVIARRPWWKRIWHTGLRDKRHWPLALAARSERHDLPRRNESTLTCAQVFQEAVLSRTDPVFRYGPHAIACSAFFDFLLFHSREMATLGSVRSEASSELAEWRQALGVDASQKYNGDEGSGLAAMGQWAMLRSGTEHLGQYPISIFASFSRDREASIPHDYIYGLLGLLAEHIRPGIKIDYEASHWDLYAAVTEMLITDDTEGSIGVYSMMSFHGSDEHPSWIPDFANQSVSGPCSGSLLVMENCCSFPPARAFSSDKNVLMLAGMLLGTVADVRTLPEKSFDFVQTISEFSPLARETVGSSLKTALRRMVFGNNGFRGPPLDDESELDRIWALLVDDPATYAAVLASDSGQDARDELQGYSDAAVSLTLITMALVTSAGRALFTSSAGLVGIGVPTMRAGDALVYLYGMRAPFVLRPNGDRYTVLGATRVAGFDVAASLERYCREHQTAETTFRLG
ncbi:hypothetical protein LTR53_013346 [Teratosphaeriaceae sp. CCFEE 6253]|nr:hypothetical protein LTR53_013346 [Teratosphaeriaceae sp. CCFEE 6253]